MQESRLCPSAFRLVLSLVARQHILVFILFSLEEEGVTISNFDCPNAEKHSSIWPSGWNLGCTSAEATMSSSSLLLPSRVFPEDCKIATCPFIGDIDGGVVLTSISCGSWSRNDEWWKLNPKFFLVARRNLDVAYFSRRAASFTATVKIGIQCNGVGIWA